MKKLSFILALMLVLTCAVLAACGGDEDTSSAASSEASSEAASSEVSSEAASSEDASSEASSEEVSSEDSSTESSDAPVVDAGDENIAAGVSYTACEQYKQGGADVNWGWSDTAPYAYPDENGNSLTDGKKPADDADYQAVEWAGWTGAHPNYAADGYIWMTLDLGETKDIAKVNVWYGTQVLGNGIGAPQTIEALVSDDGETWTSLNDAIPANSDAVLNECVSLEGAASGRFVQIRIFTAGWVFLSEIEVFAPAA